MLTKIQSLALTMITMMRSSTSQTISVPFGTAYLNDDDELVAFTKDSTALTGKVNNDGDFEVGDVTYEFSTNDFTGGAVFTNTTATDEDMDSKLTSGAIEDYAADNADGGKTVTINAEVSGKKIKDVYSVVAWSIDYDESSADLASSDVQDGRSRSRTSRRKLPLKMTTTTLTSIHSS